MVQGGSTGVVRIGVLEVSVWNLVLAWLAYAKAYLDGLDDASIKSRCAARCLDTLSWCSCMYGLLGNSCYLHCCGRLELGRDQSSTLLEFSAWTVVVFIGAVHNT